MNTYLITEDEIRAQSFSNAWQAISALRPTWPKTTPAFVKNGRMAFERLQEVPIAEVKEIQYLTRDRARVRFGPEAQEMIVVVFEVKPSKCRHDLRVIRAGTGSR